MSRATLIAADLAVFLFGLVLLVGGLPAMVFLSPMAQELGGIRAAKLWQFTCLLAQVVGAACAFIALSNLETR